MKRPVCVWPDDLDDADLKYELHWTLHRLLWRLDFYLERSWRGLAQCFDFDRKGTCLWSWGCRSAATRRCLPCAASPPRPLQVAFSRGPWIPFFFQKYFSQRFFRNYFLVCFWPKKRPPCQLELERFFCKGNDWNDKWGNHELSIQPNMSKIFFRFTLCGLIYTSLQWDNSFVP